MSCIALYRFNFSACVSKFCSSLCTVLRVHAYPCSGEINTTVKNGEATLMKIKEYFSELNPVVDLTDGVSLDFDSWRTNIRISNTEPLLRLNIETKANPELLRKKVLEISSIIEP